MAIQQHRAASALGLLAVCIMTGYASAAPAAWGGASVSAERVVKEPVVSASNSAFDYSYNPASFVWATEQYLLVRIQNFNATIGPYAVGPSMMALGKLTSPTTADKVDTIVFQPSVPAEKCGTEDPRIVQHDGITYLFYTAYDCHKAALSLAVTTDPTDPDAWVRHGALFPELGWSKSGACLIREEGLHYLFFGDSTLVPGLQIATSTDLIHWTREQDKLLIKVRPDSFDSHLVEGGPPPVPLSDGNYLFVYNSARAGFPSPKPGYDLQYNPGYVILNGSDPTQVLQRSDMPLLSPELSWETGNTTTPRSLTPHVIFVEASFPTPEPDSFYFYYGAADTDIGVAQVTVKLEMA